MTKEEVAAVLDEIGTLLELKGENPFRCNAYHNGARAVQQMSGNLAEIVRAGQLAQVPGIGATLRETITTLVADGRLPILEELRASIPAGLVEMLRIPGMGPKKVKAVHEQLGITDLASLRASCELGKVAALKGFGAKTQQKILEGIQFINEVGQRVRIDQALPLGQALLAQVKAMPGVLRAELCGSLRRRRDTAKDIDILASAKDAGPIMEAFVSLPQVKQVVAQGETKSSIVVQEFVQGERVTLNADLRVVPDKSFPFALHYFTGSKDHNVRVRARAQDRGLKLNEYELVGEAGKVACKDEKELFAALDLHYIPPEMREDTGEIDLAAEKQALPRLIEVKDIRGVFHNHTTYSDGKNSLEDMAEAARYLGFEYLGIGDHSQSLTIARGMSVRDVHRQWKEIDALNEQAIGIRLLKGVEVDILEDGSLDYSDEVLKGFDYVVASVHTHFNQTVEVMTDRIIRAIRHPMVTMLGHPTGRLLLKRDGYKVDLDRVLEACAEAGTMVEINAQPMRLDLDWIYCKRAKALGIPLVINPDAHSCDELAVFEFGVDVARRAWLEKEDVFNSRSLKEISKVLRI